MSSTGNTITPHSNFQLIIDALADYANQTGTDLSQNPFAEKIRHLNAPDAILELLQEREKAFQEYRNANRGLIDCLSPAVRVLHAFSGLLGEAVSLVSYACFVRLYVSTLMS
jgi:fungal STAND N-terminal Goodbye domain